MSMLQLSRLLQFYIVLLKKYVKSETHKVHELILFLEEVVAFLHGQDRFSITEKIDGYPTWA